MENLKPHVIIDYLIKEIDLCEPLEEVYKSYCDDLFNICDLHKDLKYSSYRQRFMTKILAMEKKDIITFCNNEYFNIEIYKIEEILDRYFTSEDYDVYISQEYNNYIESDENSD